MPGMGWGSPVLRVTGMVCCRESVEILSGAVKGQQQIFEWLGELGEIAWSSGSGNNGTITEMEVDCVAAR